VVVTAPADPVNALALPAAVIARDSVAKADPPASPVPHEVITADLVPVAKGVTARSIATSVALAAMIDAINVPRHRFPCLRLIWLSSPTKQGWSRSPARSR
jgi:hypothetical protein